MVVGARKSEVEEAYRPGHALGNKLFTGLLASLFGRSFSDIFSGYRVFSRRFAKSFPALSRGFETETEISVHALELAMPVGEVVTAYGARPEGSHSKLSTYRDGWRILKTILHLYRIERPVLFYGSFALFLAALAIVLAIPLAITYFQTGLVPRFPTAILATGLMILAFLSFFTGLILDTVVRGRREVRRLHYLSFPAPGRRLIVTLVQRCVANLRQTARRSCFPASATATTRSSLCALGAERPRHPNRRRAHGCRGRSAPNEDKLLRVEGVAEAGKQDRRAVRRRIATHRCTSVTINRRRAPGSSNNGAAGPRAGPLPRCRG